MWVQHQSLIKTAEENASLRQRVGRLTELAAENKRLSNQLAEAKSPITANPSSELLRLRGEVGGLRRQLAEVSKRANDQASALQQAPGSDHTQQIMAQKTMAVAKMGYMQRWMQALTQFAEQNQGQFPTNLNVAAPLLSQDAVNQDIFTPDQFEMVYQGSAKDITNGQYVIVMRERDPWQAVDGGWVRGYSFADGHIEIHKAEDGNFEPWEAQHVAMAPGAAQPGQ
jgi:hypothetical protein